jgi:hypothetical protein
MKTITVPDLVLLNANDWKLLCVNPISATFILNSDPNSQLKGAFKLAKFGESTPPLFAGDAAVCVKQMCYTKPPTPGMLMMVAKIYIQDAGYQVFVWSSSIVVEY